MKRPPTPIPAAPRCELGEGLVWDPRSGKLVWVDLLVGRVHELDPATGSVSTVELGGPVSALLPEAAGWTVCTEHGVATLGPDWQVLASVTILQADDRVRMNDAALSTGGFLFAGTLSYDEEPGRGILFCIAPDGSYAVVQRGVGISNGIGWSPDGAVMYHADTLAGSVTRRAFDQQSGATGAPEPWAVLEPGAMPDGLAVDSEGTVWVAMWEGSCVLGIDPTGRVRERIDLPVRRPTCPAFGGPDLATLYVTSARDEQGAGGEVFAIEMAAPGLPVPVPDLDPHRLERTHP